MRISQPLRRMGAASDRRNAWLQRTRRVAVARATRGRSVYCEITGQTGRPLELHHLMNRRDFPWSHHPACVVIVTVDLHRDLEQERLQELHAELRWKACRQIALEFGALEWFEMTLPVGSTPFDAWRQLVAYLDERYQYDADLNAGVAKS